MKTNILTPLVQFFLKNIKNKYIVFVVALSSGILLFANDTWLNALYLSGFVNKYGEYVGLVFVFTFSISFISIADSVYRFAKRKNISSQNKKYLLEILNDNKSSEYSLIQYIYKNGGSGGLTYNDYHVRNLYNKNIIYTLDKYIDIISNEVNYMFSMWAYTIIEQGFEK